VKDQRAEYAAYLRGAAERRFGAARAPGARADHRGRRGWMTELATFPVGDDEQPAFYGEPAS
jgi:hypothetical protein